MGLLTLSGAAWAGDLEVVPPAAVSIICHSQNFMVQPVLYSWIVHCLSPVGTVLAYHDHFTAQAGELGETPAAASKPPAASKPSAVPERQRPASDERRSQAERQESVPRQLDGNAGSRTDRKAAEKEAESEY